MILVVLYLFYLQCRSGNIAENDAKNALFQILILLVL